jgi:ComF family protein
MEAKRKNNWVQSVVHFLSYLLFANRCACCSQVIYRGEQLCEDCKINLPKVPDGVCPACEKPFQKCRCYQRTRFAYTAPTFYKGSVKEGLLNLKGGNDTHSVPFFADLMAKAVTERFGGGFDGIVYVPITPQKLKLRGYNQSRLLALALGERLDLPVLEDALFKLYETKDQHKSSAYRRRGNVFGVFEAEEKLVAGKHLILVDDIITTGFTMDECGKMLLIRGCEEVCGVAVASTVNRVRQKPRHRYRKIQMTQKQEPF